jgi:hypothetical protein
MIDMQNNRPNEQSTGFQDLSARNPRHAEGCRCTICIPVAPQEVPAPRLHKTEIVLKEVEKDLTQELSLNLTRDLLKAVLACKRSLNILVLFLVWVPLVLGFLWVVLRVAEVR